MHSSVPSGGNTRIRKVRSLGLRPRATLLVVDDEPDTCEMLCLLFADHFEVVAVGGGQQALDVLGSRPVDVVLLDLLLPGLDGLAVLERLRAGGCKARVVVLSGLVRAETVVAAMRLGAVDYVTKPFDPYHLRLVVEAARRRTTGGPRPTGILLLGTDVGHRAALAVALGTRFDIEAAGNGDTVRGLAAGRRHTVVVVDAGHPAHGAEIATLLGAVGSDVPTFVIVEGPTEVPSPAGARLRIYRRPLRLGKLVEEIEGLVGRRKPSAGLAPISAQVARGIEFMGARFRDAQVQAVADAAAVSAGHLSRLFRQQLAQSVKEFLDSVRIAVASHLLAETDAKVQVVARQAGFYDASHLSRVLRRRHGVSPRSLRAS